MLFRGFLTGLEERRYSAAYRRRLGLGLHEFSKWLQLHGPGDVRIIRKHRRRLDVLLARFVDFCFNSGILYDTAKHAVLAVQQVLHLKRELPRVWSSLKAWHLSLPSSHRVPMPVDVLMALFTLGLDLWLSAVGPPLLLPLVVLSRVGFYGLLRPGELFGLKRCDVLIQLDHADGPVAVLVLRRPKNRAAMGRQQFSLVRDPRTVAWLAWLVQDLADSANLWPSTGVKFRTLFGELCARLGQPEDSCCATRDRAFETTRT